MMTLEQIAAHPAVQSMPSISNETPTAMRERVRRVVEPIAGRLLSDQQVDAIAVLLLAGRFRMARNTIQELVEHVTIRREARRPAPARAAARQRAFWIPFLVALVAIGMLLDRLLAGAN